VGPDGTVYVGSADQSFYAINADGTQKWMVQTGGIIDSSALLDELGHVYFGSGDGHLRACDAQTGAVLWDFAADPISVNSAYLNWFEGNIAISGDTLYVPNDNYFIYAINRRSGQVEWRFTTPNQTWSLPAVDQSSGQLYVGNNEVLKFLGNNTFAIAADGGSVWQASSPGTIAASPLLLAGARTVVVGGFDGYVHAYDTDAGTQQWSAPTRDHIYASPSTLPDGTIIQPSADGTVYALDPSSGAVRWTFDTPEAIRSSAAIDGKGNIYFGGGNGVLYVLNPDGSFRWSIQLIDQDRKNLNASPALSNNGIFIAGESGQVFAVPLDYCLRPTQTTNPKCSTSPPPKGPDNAGTMEFTSSFGGLELTPPAQIDPNEPLAFTLRVRQGGTTQLSILDTSSFQVTVSPNAAVSVVFSGDGKFVSVIPQSSFTGDASGNVTISLQGSYLVNLQRSGLAVKGGTVGGTVSSTFTFALSKPETFATPTVVTAPAQIGGPAGTMELSRLAIPLPTILPSYNQIGFDSLRYIVGMVEGNGQTGTAWMVGAMTLKGIATPVVDPNSQTLMPLAVSYGGGLLTLSNNGGLAVDVQGILIPMETFRVSAHLAADGTVPSAAAITGSTICRDIATYGVFLEQLGFCNPQTDRLTIVGASNMGPYHGGTVSGPAGLGTVTFARGSAAITATLTSSTLVLSQHLASVLLIDPSTSQALVVPYGTATTRTAASDGTISTVSVPLPSGAPSSIRAYLMIDSYPAAVTTL
jgi:outer membrane protein assembly factor BamB